MVSQSHPADYPLMVADCIARADRLTPLDYEFIVTLHGRLTVMTSLTKDEKSTLDDIWERATERG